MKLRHLILLSAFLLGASSCAHLSKNGDDVLNKILVVTLDGEMILNGVDTAVTLFFSENHVEPSTRDSYTAYLKKARTALNAVLRIAQGGVALQDGRVEAALGEFRLAYGELANFLSEIGVLRKDGLVRKKSDLYGSPFPRPLADTFTLGAR